jgi:hypothetical protein
MTIGLGFQRQSIGLAGRIGFALPLFSRFPATNESV